MEREFKGIWIPKEIWLSEELTLQEKVFYVEIDSLDNEKGCYANNAYFAKFFGLGTTRVSLIIKSLIKKGFISSRILEAEGNIRYLSTLFHKSERPSFTKVKDPLSQKGKHNNTVNNTVNNLNISSKEDTTQALVLQTDPDINEMQKEIKEKVKLHKWIYKAGRNERSRIHNLLTGKEYGKVCEDSNMDRKTFALAIIDLSSKLPFWNGKIYNAETLYKHYASVYNEGIRIKTEIQGKQEKFINYT